MEEAKGPAQERGAAELTKQIGRLCRKLESYEQLAEIVRNATVIDQNIYRNEENDGWLSIDRDDYMKMMAALSQFDLWKPWKSKI